MAKIILDPGERFEHFHSVRSTSTLLKGELLYEADEQKIVLEAGKKIITAANTSHAIVNIGDAEAIFECGHVDW